MLYQIIIVFHILLGIGIIGLVLMQQGKGADAGAAFGSGASGSVFGAQGSASFLSRSTAIFATLFFITSLGLAFLSGHQSKKADIIMDTPAAPAQKEDVPLTQSTVEQSVPVATLPSEQPIKEVDPSAPAE
ncbi:preprotein translocase subunit SecG [Methylomonas rhizoryzae]|uniref:preprotein translocase subunit SecG n=1 Tax=Methylomonas sp. HYX-M1 TaxID=3139307 RepID=UPI0018D6E164